jgi:hypothetical protein
MTARALPRDGRTAEWADPVTASAAAVSERHGLSFVDGATLALIALVVVLVSLPRLRRFALRENETDAIRMLRVLSDDALGNGEALASGNLAALLASSADHHVRLEDVEVLDGGRLRRHGYVFAGLEPVAGRFVLIAWPWEHGRTGLGAFAIEPGGEPLGLPNSDGRFSGPGSPPPPPPPSPGEDDAWRPVVGF